ncbi:hypothetical protein vseg_013753 [Gypsophila vaccaria]
MAELADRLINAAWEGNVDFLRKMYVEYDRDADVMAFLLGSSSRGSSLMGNMIHRAVKNNHYTFVSEALKLLRPNGVIELVCEPNGLDGSNPLHYAAKEGNIFIVKLLVHAYVTAATALDTQGVPPWLGSNLEGDTTVHCCFTKKVLEEKHECVARYLVSRDHHMLRSLGGHKYPPRPEQSSTTTTLDKTGASVLFYAVREGFSKLAEQILTSGLPYSHSGTCGENPLHHASKCNELVSRLLLQKHPEFIGKEPGNGDTVLDRAVEDNAAWLVTLMLTEDEGCIRYCPRPWIKSCRRLIWHINPNSFGDTPLHIAARKGCTDIAKLVVEGSKSAIRGEAEEWDVAEAHSTMDCLGVNLLHIMNCQEDLPLFVALKNKHDDFGLYILSIETISNITELRDGEGKNAYEIAVENNCEQSKKAILERTVRHSIEELLNSEADVKLMNPSMLKILRNIASAYSASNEMLTSENIAKLVMEGLPKFKRESDKDAITHLIEAAERGDDWLVTLLLKGDKSLIADSIPAWQIACEKGRVSTLLAFIEQCGRQEFVSLCKRNQLTPLHRINLLSYEQYRELLTNPAMHELMNQLDSGGATPLHRALEGGNTSLAKALLRSKDVRFDIMDRSDTTALDMIQGRCSIKSKDVFWYELYTMLWENPDRLEMMMKKYGGSIATPLQITVVWDDLKMANKLVRIEGIKLNITDDTNKKTALDIIVKQCENDSRWYELYKEVLLNPDYLHELKNRRVGKETPLHVAIKRDDIKLAKKLLKTNYLEVDGLDGDGKTALDLLKDLYACDKWGDMCREINVDPNLNVFGCKYLLRRTPYIEMRTTLSVVAALLATISFGSGFTVPGGVDKYGTATLATKAVFLVFSVFNTLAMCSSIVVLFMVIGALYWEAHPDTIPLIDRCIGLLQFSLLCTIVAFVSGVYAIMALKVMWAVGLVIGLCAVAFFVALYVIATFWPPLHKLFGCRFCICCRNQAKTDDLIPPQHQNPRPDTVLVVQMDQGLQPCWSNCCCLATK